MTSKETTYTIVKITELLTQWPVIFLVIILLLKKEIRKNFNEFSRKNMKVKMGENELEITNYNENFTKATNDAFKEVITRGIKEYNNKPKELEKYIIEQANKLQQIKTTQETDISPSFIDQATGYIKNFFSNCIEKKNIQKKNHYQQLKVVHFFGQMTMLKIIF